MLSKSLHSWAVVVFCVLPLTTLISCPKPEVQKVEQTIGQGGGTMALGDASLGVPAGALEVDVSLTLTKDKSGETVNLAENDRAVSSVFTLTHDQEITLASVGEAFVLELPFDTKGISAEELNSLKVFVKVQIGEEKGVLIGDVSSGLVRVVLLGLPAHASFRVCHNPHMEGVESDPVDGGKLLTQNPPWQTTQWYVQYDSKDKALRTAVANVLSKNESDVGNSEILQVVREYVANNARDASRYYEGLGLRQPNLIVRDVKGEQRLVLSLMDGNDYQAGFAMGGAGNGIGQIIISSSLIDNPPTFFLGTVKDYIAHEMFHSCMDGYDLKQRANGDMHRTDIGYAEGCAVVMGNTFDKGVVSVRQNVPGFDFTQMLDAPVGTGIPLGAAYANDDFFAYVGRRFDGNSMRYLGGHGTDSDGDSNGMLEQIRKHMLTQSPLLTFVSPKEWFYESYRVGMQKSFRLQFGVSLANVYWDFARNRAYENNDESRLRPGDNDTRYSMNKNRFSAGTVLEHTFLSKDESVELLSGTSPALRNIGPFSTRAVMLYASDFKADLELTFNASEWEADGYGNSMFVKAYKNGEDGVELPVGSDTMTIHLEEESGEVIVLLSNVNTSNAYSVNITASMKPSGDEKGGVAGRVTEAVTGDPLEGVAVVVHASGQAETIGSASTDANGQFTILDLPVGPVEFSFTKSLYVPVTQTAMVIADQTTQIAVTLVVEETPITTGSAGGTVIDAVTGLGLGGVLLVLREGILTVDDIGRPSVATTTTAGDGSYSFSAIQAGTYTVFGSKVDYATGTFVVYVVGGESRTGQNGALSPVLEQDSARIILTWGAIPRDLDSHLTGPSDSGTGRFHLFYPYKELGSGLGSPEPGHISLDLDDTDGNGPETTTIYTRYPGTYRFSVHDFTNKQNPGMQMSNSGAKVKVVTRSSTLEFNIRPNTSATLWTVFEIDGTTGKLTEKQEYGYATSPWSVLKSFEEIDFVGSESPTLFTDLPEK